MRSGCRALARGTLLRRSLHMLTVLMMVAGYRKFQRASRRGKAAP